MTLCGRLPRVEWSGTLFYSVTGEFGEPDFAITAEELYLQDIGSATYTEYETGDPDFIQFLMQRSDLRVMRQGHIHSHNSMGSFFSGTDDDELIENSEFHNYYFSLIVNNKNEMVGKVAFRAQVDSETKASMIFKGTDGQPKEKHMTTKNQTTYVYAYNCDMEVPEVVNQIEQALEKQEEKDEARREANRKSTYGSYGTSYNTSTYNGRLFGGPEEEEETPVINMPSEFGDSSEEEIPETRAEKKGGIAWRRKRASRPLNRKSVDFLIKLLKMDKGANGKIEETLEEVVGDIWRDKKNDEYFAEISDKLPYLYMEVFPNDQKLDGIDDTIYDCLDLLDLYEDKYPNFTERMIDVFTKYLTPTV